MAKTGTGWMVYPPVALGGGSSCFTWWYTILWSVSPPTMSRQNRLGEIALTAKTGGTHQRIHRGAHKYDSFCETTREAAVEAQHSLTNKSREKNDIISCPRIPSPQKEANQKSLTTKKLSSFGLCSHSNRWHSPGLTKPRISDRSFLSVLLFH